MAKDNSPTEDSVPLAEIEHGPSKFEQFLERNHKRLIIIVTMLILAIAGTYLYSEVQQSSEEAAGAELIDASLQAESAEQLAERLEQVATSHQGRKAATTASLLRARALWQSDQKEEAISSLDSFIKAHPKHPEIGALLLKLANYQIGLGKSADAKANLESITTNPATLYAAPHALILLGDIAALEGDDETAKAHYERIAKDFPESRTANLAGPNLPSIVADRIALLGVEPPREFIPQDDPSEDLPLPTPGSALDQPLELFPDQQPSIQLPVEPPTPEPTDSPDPAPADPEPS